MSSGYSWKYLQEHYKTHLPRDNLGEQKVLKSVIFRLSKRLKSKILATRVPPPDILGLLQTSGFELLWGWNVCLHRVKQAPGLPCHVWVFFAFLEKRKQKQILFMKSTFSFLYVDIYFDLQNCIFILKNSRLEYWLFSPIFVVDRKISFGFNFRAPLINAC